MNEMEIIGEEQDIKHFKDEIDYEDSQIYLGPFDSEKISNLWVEPEDVSKMEKNEEKKVKFFTIKNTYEYPHEEENVKTTVKKEVISKKKEKKSKNNFDNELTEAELKRLEEVRMRRKQAEEIEKFKKEKEKAEEEENKEKNKEKEEEEKKRKERQERNAMLVKNKKKKKKK